MRRRAFVAFLPVLIALAALVAVERMATDFVRAPNAERVPPARPVPGDIDATLRVEVGPPSATLDVWILEPAAAPRATMLILHGLADDKRSMLRAGRSFRDLGFRTVLIDLRGHGQSTGSVLTFGVVEGQDIVQVLDALEAREPLDGPVGVYGTSYGGAVAHQLAGRDPRVRAVATVSALSNIENLIRAWAELSWPWVEWALPDALLERYVPSRIAVHGGFTVEAADAAAALARSDAAVLLFHGERDEVVPFVHALRLHHACAARGCELVRLPEADHLGAMGDPQVGLRAREFLADALLREPNR